MAKAGIFDDAGMIAAVSFAALLFAASSGLAQSGAGQDGAASNPRSGFSRPDPALIETTPDDPPAPVHEAPRYEAPAKPSAAIPFPAPVQAAPTASADDTILETNRRPLNADTMSARKKPADDPDAGIVTSVPSRPNELPEGTLVKVKLRQTLSTMTTRPGTAFSGEVAQALMSNGKVLVPEGSLVTGRVTMVRSGRRIGGGAAMHLEPRTVTLPDGSQYLLQARVIDTDRWNETKVDTEGTIKRRGEAKATITTMSIAAGSGAIAGGVIAGPPGALIGAGVGAGIGTVIWLKEDRQAELPKDLVLVFSLTSPMLVTPDTALVHRAHTAGAGE